ncbi:MAG TPA: amidase [Polyangiaceae bacterium]|nr:amidase [Polyangiaceae bacterium]
MPTPSDLLAASALEQARLVRERQVSCRELAELYLRRIEALDPTLSAFVEVSADAALAQARRYDRLGRSAARPLFFGVPVGVKDLNMLRGCRTRFGTRALPPLVAPVDDAVVGLMRRAGFVFLGKTSTSELGAMPVTEPDIHPPTRNPWALGHSAGGSSGGSAAAVAAGLLPIAQAGDGAGSVRIPASFNHLYGFKPSRGRVPEPFHQDDRDILYTMGPLARTVADAAALLDVLSGLEAGAPHWAPPPPQRFVERMRRPPPRLRVRFAARTPLCEVDPEVREAVLRVARLLESLGHAVEEGEMVAGSVDEFLEIWPAIVRLFPIRDWSLVQPVTRWLAELGAGATPEGVRARQREFERRVLAWFEGADVWLTPTVPVPPPAIGAWSGLEPAEAFARASVIGPFTAAFNVSGQPAASLPAGVNRAGLPIGVQLVGKPLADALLLALSRQLEEAMPWAGRHPPLWSARPPRRAASN